MKNLLTTLTTIIAFAILTSAFAGSAKLDVCHIPPGNPENYHTIRISENALDAHLAHGDLEDGCLENCDTFCDDEDACTQDVLSRIDECICQPIPGPAVSCDDGNVCTIDSCQSLNACTYNTTNQTGIACDDGDGATVNDRCTNGVCAGVLPNQ